MKSSHVVVRAAVNADGLQAMVYATEGFEIPRAWTCVQLSPHIALALRSGDLEELGPGDRPLSKQEVEQKYGSGPLQRRAIHRPFRPPVRRGQSAKEKPLSLLPAPAPAAQDVVAPASAQRRRGRPSKEAAERVRRRNELVGILIAKDVEPTRAYQEVADKFDDTSDAVRVSYQRSLKPAKNPKLSTPTK
jgi:hypothetical protein